MLQPGIGSCGTWQGPPGPTVVQACTAAATAEASCRTPGTPQVGIGEQPTAKNRYSSVYVRAVALSRRVSGSTLQAPSRLSARRRCPLAENRRQVPTPSRLAGHRVHQPGQRGLPLHACAGVGQRRRVQRARIAGCRPHLPLPFLCVHGKRDFLPAQAVPSRREQGQVLGQMPPHHRHAEQQHAPHQQRAWFFHGGLH